MLSYKTMEEHKNFTVTLHLSHFFQDHRSTCKIFISSEMKYVIDLQEHIQKIFQIKNFYFISNGCYIPATEDVRVFQPNDVIIAIPTQTINRVTTTISTSTPVARDVDFSTSRGKRRREIVIEEEVMDTESSNKDVEVKSKRKKKNKFAVDISVPDVNENLQFENLVTPIVHKETKGCKNLVYDKQEEYQPMEHEEIKTNNKNDTAKSKRKSRKSAPSKQEENLLNNSVKEKVEYFEIHSNANKSKNENEIDSKTNETEEHHRSEANLQKNDSDLVNRENDDDSEIFKQKKLFVHKRNNNLINFDLPKKSNIVKSILISNKPWEQDSSSLNPLIGHDHESHDIILNADINISHKKTNESCNIKRNITQYSPKELTKGKMSLSTSTNNLVVSSSKDLEMEHKLNDENSKNMDVYESKETNTSSQSEIIPVTTSNSRQLNTVENIPSNIQSSPNKDVESVNSSVTDNVNNTEQSSEHSFFKFSSSQGHSLLESTRETEADLNVFCNSIVVAEESGFITRRRRKRSHRKRKSKTKAENEVAPIKTSMEPYPKTSQFYSKMSWGSASPTVHIKFDDDDDDEPVPSTKNDVEEKILNLVESVKVISEEMVSRKEKIPIENPEVISEEMVSLRNENVDAGTGLVNGTDDASNAESVKADKSSKNAPSELNNYSMDSTRICDETADEISKLFASAPCLISEDTILKSPSMTVTKPRCKDIIAFKILRLTTNYTPEVSKYIIGEVQSVSDDCSDIDINIIDGAEECKEPDGKFCLGDSNEKLENVNCVKSFSWSSLIDPRLIFP